MEILTDGPSESESELAAHAQTCRLCVTGRRVWSRQMAQVTMMSLAHVSVPLHTLDFSIQCLGLKDCRKNIYKNCSDLEINNFRPLHWMCIDIGHWEDRKQADASFEPQLGLNLQLKRIFTCQYSTDHRVKTPAHHLILEQISGHYCFEHYFNEWWTHKDSNIHTWLNEYLARL